MTQGPVPGPVLLLAVAAVGLVAWRGATAAELAPEPNSVPKPRAAFEPSLKQADGALRHLFSVWFAADRSQLDTVTGLVTQRVARTAGGGELEVTFPAGVPYPRGAGSVVFREVPDPRNASIIDHQALPVPTPERPGHAIQTSHRVAGRLSQYWIVWRNQATGEHSIGLFDAATPREAQPTIARSGAPIIGVAEMPSIRAAERYLTVWTIPAHDAEAGRDRQVVVEAYTWRATGS